MTLYVGWIRIQHPATRQPGPWVRATRPIPSRRLTRAVARQVVPLESRRRLEVLLLLSPGETPNCVGV